MSLLFNDLSESKKNGAESESNSPPATFGWSVDWATNERLNSCWTWQRKFVSDSSASIIGRKTFKHEQNATRMTIWIGAWGVRGGLSYLCHRARTVFAEIFVCEGLVVLTVSGELHLHWKVWSTVQGKQILAKDYLPLLSVIYGGQETR